MREFQDRQKQQNNLKRIMNSWWFLIILLIIFGFFIRGNIRIYRNYFQVKNKYNDDLKEYNDLENRSLQLDKDIKRLNTDDGLDYEIRKKLDVSKTDEKIIKIIDKK